jgi:hypothetical protein
MMRSPTPAAHWPYYLAAGAIGALTAILVYLWRS